MTLQLVETLAAHLGRTILAEYAAVETVAVYYLLEAVEVLAEVCPRPQLDRRRAELPRCVGIAGLGAQLRAPTMPSENSA